MSFTPEERLEYWKKRTMDHCLSTSDQVALDFKTMFLDLGHAGFELEDFTKAFAKISEGFSDFTKAIASAKKKEVKPVEEPATIPVEEMPIEPVI
jgi:hypothetical protein